MFPKWVPECYITEHCSPSNNNKQQLNKERNRNQLNFTDSWIANEVKETKGDIFPFVLSKYIQRSRKVELNVALQFEVGISVIHRRADLHAHLFQKQIYC
jgi:hypothetical protein